MSSVARPSRPLTLRRDQLTGEDVRAAQVALRVRPVDGFFGPQTAQACFDWSWRVGIAIPGNHLSVRDQRILLGLSPRSLAMGRLAHKRRDTPPPGLNDGGSNALVIVSRADWGARAPRTRREVIYPAGVDLWHHWSAAPAPVATRRAEIAEMRRIQAFHMGPERGWSDIGYAFVVGPSGTIYVGRGWEVAAAHCPGQNHKPSICLMGNASEPPTPAQLDAVRAFARLRETGRKRGHRHGFPTSCPGDIIVAELGLS